MKASLLSFPYFHYNAGLNGLVSWLKPVLNSGPCLMKDRCQKFLGNNGKELVERFQETEAMGWIYLIWYSGIYIRIYFMIQWDIYQDILYLPRPWKTNFWEKLHYPRKRWCSVGWLHHEMLRYNCFLDCSRDGWILGKHRPGISPFLSLAKWAIGLAQEWLTCILY